MNGRVISLVVVVAALTGYHLSQRSLPTSLRPTTLFAFVYAVGMIVMAAVAISTGAAGGVRAFTDNATHWSPWLLAASVVGIELGVYAMYQSGWSISTASTTTQALTAVILVVIGLVHFGEHLTLQRGLGLVLCVAGAAMVAR